MVIGPSNKFSVYRLLFITLTLLSFSLPLSSQKVGLVLSGGGAKGCAHIGIIRALEEEGIPIDYVAGSSMGAIIGSLYAMGFSPDEMEALVASEEFTSWQRNDIDEDDTYYFKHNDPTPAFVNIKMHLSDSMKLETHLLPSSIIGPTQMNIAFMKLYAQAGALCEGDFDRLFVPFRCVASDVHNKREYLHRKGDLGDAVRSSMTFPLVYKPIQVNGHLLFDGGIYNNFPVDLMESDFAPDYMIGSNVSSNPLEPNETDIVLQLENMIMNKTDYSIDKSKGLLFDFHFENVGLLDFHRIHELSRAGYDSTKAHIAEIKASVARRVDKQNIRLRREIYKSQLPNLVFRSIEINGVSEKQKHYIRKSFHTGNERFSFSQFKKNYFKLLSDKKIAEIIPHAVYNPADSTFNLVLDVKLNDNILIDLGGNVSSTSSNLLYFGAEYQGIYYFPYSMKVGCQFGRFYNDLHLQSRVDLTTAYPLYLKLVGNVHRFSYFQDESPFYEAEIPSESSSLETYGKFKLGFPFLMTGKMELGWGYGNISNEYLGYDVPSDERNRTDHHLFVSAFRVQSSTLSHKQYPIAGRELLLLLQHATGNRQNSVFLRSENDVARYRFSEFESWMQIRARWEQYFRMTRHFSLGSCMEGVFSSQDLTENYMETILMTPAFEPTPHSMVNLNPAFRSTCFLAGGIKPIFKFNNRVHLRSENYLFVPFRRILPNGYYQPYTLGIFSTDGDATYHVEYLSELSLVAQMKFIAASLFVNYYSYPERNFNYGLSIGYLIPYARLVE
ncbi:MAG: patatin-like phospholipase family protein [Paludibacteraceae bacterium]|nr:patatin-like phospholipase family protein [Paludibacteraceae bacterium]